MIGERKVLAVITARGGSKGLPGKNIRPLGGLPLIGWTIKATKASRYIDRIILSSDDPEIMAVATDLGCDVPFVRSSNLASDDATSIDVVLDALERVPGYDVVVLLQPTSPLRNADDIDGTIALLQSASSAVSATPALTHPWLVYRPNPSGLLSPYVVPVATSFRRQDMPPALMLNGAVYAADVAWLKREKSFLRDGQTQVWSMPLDRSIDIDTLEDLEEAERACRLQSN